MTRNSVIVVEENIHYLIFYCQNANKALLRTTLRTIYMCVWCVISKLIKVMDCYHVIDLFHVTLAHRNSRVPGNKNIGLNISSQIKSLNT